MLIEHSPLVNGFDSFRFGTPVDGALRYETVGDYLESEWQTRLSGAAGLTLLTGQFSRSLSDDAMAASIHPVIEHAITDGRI